jgi:hypothetical protein
VRSGVEGRLARLGATPDFHNGLLAVLRRHDARHMTPPHVAGH